MRNEVDFMRAALLQAEKAVAMREVPVGAVAVWQDEIIEVSHNIREATGNPLGHAEMLLLQKLSARRGAWRLSDVTIYVTCEPCVMCAGALWQARIKRVVFGCADPKGGAMGSLYSIHADTRLNHRIEVTGGILAIECGAILSKFFKELREEKG